MKNIHRVLCVVMISALAAVMLMAFGEVIWMAATNRITLTVASAIFGIISMVRVYQMEVFRQATYRLRLDEPMSGGVVHSLGR